KEHLEALARFNEGTEVRNRYFTLTWRGVRFNEYVGVLQAGDCTIEVLPKADRTSAEGDKTRWRDALLELLRVCRRLPVHALDKAFLSLRNNSILELYCRLFLDACERIVGEGLLRRYRFDEGNRPALKGKLLLGKHLRVNLVHAERFYVRHPVYDAQHGLNALLLATLRILPQLTTSPQLVVRARSLAELFPEVPVGNISEQTFARIVYDRKTERYRNALEIAELLLLRFRPDLSGGRRHVLAILFDMNALWEEYVYRKLAEVAPQYGFKAAAQESLPFWKKTGAGSKTVRPDIVLRAVDGKGRVVSNQPPLIIDTKWKLPEKLTPSDGDLKQMYVYNELWLAQESFLVYPGPRPAERSGDFHLPLGVSGTKHRCHALACSIFKEKESRQVDRAIGTGILKQALRLAGLLAEPDSIPAKSLHTQ
ncbi:MAG: restriction endonuclease, partial [Sphingobacteriales bacterium]